MSASCEDSVDIHCPLRSILERYTTGKITTQLIDIQSSRLLQQKSLEFIEELECLYLPNPRKRPFTEAGTDETRQRNWYRRTINALVNREYVVLSYTWHPSPYETECDSGGYRVQVRNPAQLKPSKVRDGVFRRIKAYMNYVGVQYLWIDQHCIDQDDESMKEIGMNAMDRVYTVSRYPVALLNRPIKSIPELQLLTEILSGELTRRFSESPRTNSDRLEEAIKLLEDITSDTWFTRGWTFQENYRAGTRMTLLMPHPPELYRQKARKYLGSMDGELCINSVDFYTNVTELCLAYQKFPENQPGLKTQCNRILARAGRYTILLQSPDKLTPKSMSPTIIADLVSRELSERWDRLPIAANCCQYSLRLDSTGLHKKKHSLSLSILALCLLNGEILSNNPDHDLDVATAKELTISGFSTRQFFDKFQSPSLTKGLTFNKGCRFVDVTLIEEGIRTRGYLWKLNKLISTKSFSRRDEAVPEEREGFLELDELRRLRRLADKVGIQGELLLCDRIHEFLDDHNNRRGFGNNQTPRQDWMDRMARSIAMAIEQGKTLCTARLLDEPARGDAIFIMENTEDSKTSQTPQLHSNAARESVTECWDPRNPRYVFTAFRSERVVSDEFDSNDLDKYVSMEVDSPDISGSRARVAVPRLFTKRWINGLCLYYGDHRPVVFPWPVSLQHL